MIFSHPSASEFNHLTHGTITAGDEVSLSEQHLSDSGECEGLPPGLGLSVLFRCLYRSGLCTSLPVGFITFSTPGSSVRRLKLKARCQLSASFAALTPPTPRPTTQYPCKVANKDKRELCKTIITSLCCQDVWICVETQGQEESITLLLHVGSPTSSQPPPPLPLNSLSGVLTRRVSQLLFRTFLSLFAVGVLA